MSSVFTKIINGEIPSYKLCEDDQFFAFLDINPNAVGHALVVPKLEVNKIFDLEEAHYLSLMKFSRKIAKAIEKAIPCERVGIAVIGLEVPHVHVHLIPLNAMEDIQFEKKVSMTPAAFNETVNKIVAFL